MCWMSSSSLWPKGGRTESVSFGALVAMGGVVSSYLSERVFSFATAQADSLVDQLLQKSVSFTKDQVSIVLDLDDEITFLRKVLPELKEMILNAEVKSDKIAEFLRGLKDFVEDAEDILDEFDTELAQRSPSPLADRQRNKCVRWFVVCAGLSMGEHRSKFLMKLVCGCIPSSSCIDSSDNESVSLAFYVKIANEIKGLYDGLGKLKSDLHKRRQFVASSEEGLGIVREQTPEVDGLLRRPITYEARRADMALVGRERDKENVIMLLLESSARPSVVLIKGIGGIGKTTLVQDLFATPDFDQHFQIKKWVYVIDELNPKEVMREIFGTDKQAEILPKLKGNRFFVVIDDCWIGKMKGWNELWDSLSHGVDGSKVLITSREDISRELEGVSMKSYELGLLSDEDCLQIFQSYAFPNGLPSSSSNTSRLQEIGRKIVYEKINGLPLAARVLGSSLKNVSKEDIWSGVLKGVARNDIMSILMWSFRRLPSHLKQCFLHVSSFPNNISHTKGAIVLMWVAQGYVQPTDYLTLECQGECYFDELVGASLIQKRSKDFYTRHELVGAITEKNYDEDVYYTHNLLRELAMNISEVSYFRNSIAASGNNRAPKLETLRHLVIGAFGLPKEYSGVYENKKLRTLINNSYYIRTDSSNFQCRHIRVLSLSPKDDLTRINVSNMMHLRYLNLYYIENRTLPESICGIYNLQTLILNLELQNFPLGMWKLPKLCHLIGGGALRMAGIGNSISLQTITCFNLFEEKDLEELGNLNELRSRLIINHLNNVHSKETALKAQLDNKEHIESLLLVWDESTSMYNEMHKDILENLCPHKNLCFLEIHHYMGGQYPRWMKENHLLNLAKLVLSHPHHLVELPPLGQLPRLEHLRIEDTQKVQCIGGGFYGTEAHVFPSLKELHLKNMSGLEVWKEYTVCMGQITRCFPSLQLLEVRSCKELKSMPRLPGHLRTLIIDSTGLKVLPEIYTCSNNSNSYDLSLEVLFLDRCSSLCPDKWFRKYRMPSLRSLVLINIGKCINLVINCSRKCLRSLTICDMAALSSITLVNLVPLQELPKFDIEELSIRLLDLIALYDISFTNWKEPILVGPLEAVGCNPFSMLPEDALENIRIKNVVDLCVDFWAYLFHVDPRKIVDLKLIMWNFDREIPHRFQKRLRWWFQNLLSIQRLSIHGGLLTERRSWPPYLPLGNLSSLKSIEFRGSGLLESFPELPPSLRKEGLKIHS